VGGKGEGGMEGGRNCNLRLWSYGSRNTYNDEQ
jgi:hypothetical protein